MIKEFQGCGCGTVEDIIEFLLVECEKECRLAVEILKQKYNIFVDMDTSNLLGINLGCNHDNDERTLIYDKDTLDFLFMVSVKNNGVDYNNDVDYYDVEDVESLIISEMDSALKHKGNCIFNSLEFISFYKTNIGATYDKLDLDKIAQCIVHKCKLISPVEFLSTLINMGDKINVILENGKFLKSVNDSEIYFMANYDLNEFYYVGLTRKNDVLTDEISFMLVTTNNYKIVTTDISCMIYHLSKIINYTRENKKLIRRPVIYLIHNTKLNEHINKKLNSYISESENNGGVTVDDVIAFTERRIIKVLGGKVPDYVLNNIVNSIKAYAGLPVIDLEKPENNESVQVNSADTMKSMTELWFRLLVENGLFD